MKNFGLFVVKPDATNKHDLQIIQSTLIKFKFKKFTCFRLQNYCELMRKYREADIQFKGRDNAETEIKICGVALEAYKQLYDKPEGIVILIPLGKQSFKEFFDKAYMAKQEIRKQIEDERGYCFASIGEANPKLVKLSHKEYLELTNNGEPNISKVDINAIHLEDYECLEQNFCLNFMIQQGVIAKQNEIDIYDMI